MKQVNNVWRCVNPSYNPQQPWSWEYSACEKDAASGNNKVTVHYSPVTKMKTMAQDECNWG
jgi:hypothetical protein